MKRAVIVFAACASVAVLSVFAQQMTVEKIPVQASSPGTQAKPQAAVDTAPSPVKGQASAQKPAGKTLRFLTSFGAPPFSFKEGMKETGFEYDLGEALGKELGAKVEWVQKNFSISTYASALDTGAAEAAISAISITDRRKRQLDFTRPYFKTDLAVATLKDITWRSNKFRTGLRNWLAGVVRGTTAETWARSNLNCTVKTYSSPTRLAQALSSANPRMLAKDLKKVDPAVATMLGAAKKWKDLKGETGFCIVLDNAVLTWLLSRRGYKFTIVERDLDHEDYGIAVKKGNTALLDELNAALEKIDESGVYDTIYEKWYAQAKDLPLFEKK